MKKFLIFSAIVGLAGIGFGLANQPNGIPATVVAQNPVADDVPEGTTSSTAAPITSTTVVAKPAVKTKTSVTTAKAATTTTTARTVAPTTPIPSPTTVTTVAVVATTSITVAKATPTCTVSVSQTTAHKYDTLEVRVTSNMPLTKTRIEIQYPKFGTGKPNPRQTFTPTTDANGTVAQPFTVIDTSTVDASVTVEFYDAAGRIMGPAPCQTAFQST